jgi:hypothetical protein
MPACPHARIPVRCEINLTFSELLCAQPLTFEGSRAFSLGTPRLLLLRPETEPQLGRRFSFHPRLVLPCHCEDASPKQPLAVTSLA